VVFGVRPEHLEAAEDSNLAEDVRFPVTVDVAEAMGAETFVHFYLDVPPVRDEELGVGTAEDESLDKDRTSVTARVDGTVRVRSGDTLVLAARTHLCHLFDPVTGRPLR
jgi:ABC-type sugar transport system ATPase subunit